MLALAFVSLLPLAEPALPVQQVDFDSTMEDAGNGISDGWKSTKRGMGHFFGWGEEAIESYLCNDRGFVASKMEDEATEEIIWRMRGTLKTPGNGYQHRFTFLGAQGTEAYMSLQVGMPMRATTAQGWAGQTHVDQKFMIYPPVSMLHVRVEGLTPQPYEILCALTPQNRLKK